jgi:signal transduction histidine kinase/ligand-binding sensor domain-containing protein
MKRTQWTLLAGAVVLALTEPALSQRSANWRVYKMRDGLPDTACVSATLSLQGKILVKHSAVPFATELDGYNISSFTSPPGSSRVYESPGGQFWTITFTGLQEMKDGVWLPHLVPAFRSDIIPRPAETIQLYPVRQGVVLCLLPDRLLEANLSLPEGNQINILRSASQTKLGKFANMVASRDGGLWLAGSNGLAKLPAPVRNLKPDSLWQEHIPPASLQVENMQQPHEDSSGGVALIGESSDTHQKVIVYFDGNSWFVQKALDNRIRHAWRGPDGTWWAAAPTALFHSETEKLELVETEEISARQYFDVALEPGGPFWLATSDGLFRFAPLTWRTPPWGRTNSSLVYCLTGDAQDRLWFISSGQLHLVQRGQHQSYPFVNTVAQELESPRSLYTLKDGSVLLEGNERAVQFHPATGRFTLLSSDSKAMRRQVLGSLKDGKVCLQAWPGETETPYSLETFDGNELQPVVFPGPDSAVGMRFSALFEAQNGDLWIGAEHGTACYHEKHWKAYSTADKSSPESPLSFLELQDGKIWCITGDKVWQFDGRDWSEVRRGFDRINTFVRSQRDGSIWVASNGGLHRLTTDGTWIENGVEDGLPSISIRSLYEDMRGRLWSGTTHGLSMYDPEADRDPPQTEIEPLAEKEQRLREGRAVTLAFLGQDKWKQTARERLLYSHRLDDQEWSSFQDTHQAVYSDLRAGPHSFQVRAMDRNGNREVKPAQLEFTIVLPWYKETRLILISLAGVAGALFFAGLAFNRHHQLVRSYGEVEKKVGERTRELEIASRELLHSQKMNALGTLAAGIAHDFNNILSIIKGSAQIIEDNLDDPKKVRTRVDRIKTVVEQGSGIVKAMLGFSRESDQQPAVSAPNLVVEDTIRLLGDRFLREVQVSFDKGPDLPMVRCPKDFVQQILINFIFNAAESMDSEKQIILSTRESATLPRELVLAPVSAPNYVYVAVQDSGCGIPPENMSRIFEPFFTTKSFSDRRGTGLGLSMVYELAKKIEAGLAVESVIGQGSTFTLILPVAAAAQEIRTQELKT